MPPFGTGFSQISETGTCGIGRHLFRTVNVTMVLAVRCSPICAASPLAPILSLRCRPSATFAFREVWPKWRQR
jgi:hypothetical protein